MQERDFLNVLEALSGSGVRYVVVGGTAVVLHGHLRVTGDLDLVVQLDQPNILAAIRTLEGRGFRPRVPVQAKDFANPAIRRSWAEEKGMLVFSMWNPSIKGFTVDVFVNEPLPFDQLYERAEKVAFGNIRVAIASIPDLITLKRQAGRPIDLEDIRVLEAIAQTRNREQAP